MAGRVAMTPPPRQLEVRRFVAARAGELLSLHDAIYSRLAGRFQQPRSARRRTTGHLPSKKRRRRSRDADEGVEALEKSFNLAERQSRRVRRHRELTGNPAEGFSVAGDGARRLRTHLWHAKRFSMERRWGFVLPIGAQGRGRGSRAIHRWLKNGTVVHDASYFIPIQLEGSEDSLLSVLRVLLSFPMSRMVLRSSPADGAPDLKHLQDKVMRGLCYENATLQLWRDGSSHSQIVGPVAYMWRPFSRVDGKLEAEERDLSSSQTRLDGRSCSSLPRQLWIWIHPATAGQGLDAIRYACAKQIQDSGGVIKCCSLEGKVARLELMGSMAVQSLKSILHPVNNSNMISMVLSTCNSSTSTDPSLGSTTGSHLRKAPVVDHAEILQPNAILPMIVRDPREVSVEETDSPSKIVPNQENKVLEGRDLVPNADEAPPEEGNVFFLSDCNDLWDSSHNLNPPVTEEILSMEKHHRHLKSFCLNCGNDPGQTQAKDCFSRSCPVLLLKHAKEGSIFPGWSVILPLSWAKPFWLFLVSHGAHAVGLRERRWIASEFKMPCFSYDYPLESSCSLSSDGKVTEAALSRN